MRHSVAFEVGMVLSLAVVLMTLPALQAPHVAMRTVLAVVVVVAEFAAAAVVDGVQSNNH